MSKEIAKTINLNSVNSTSSSNTSDNVNSTKQKEILKKMKLIKDEIKQSRIFKYKTFIETDEENKLLQKIGEVQIKIWNMFPHIASDLIK